MIDINMMDLKKGTKSKPDEYYACCPYCNDTKYHLSVNISNGLFHCYKCGSKGKIKSKDVITFTLTKDEDFDTFLEQSFAKLEGLKDTSSLNIDEFSDPISKKETPFSYDYIINDRKLDESDIIKYNIRSGKQYYDEKNKYWVKKWSGRIIFPFYENNNVVFSVGRTYINHKTKYLNSVGSKDNIVYGIDGINNNECILCEGIISSIIAEKITKVSAVAVLGKTATSMQLDKIRSRCDKIYLSLDGEVTDKEKKAFLMELIEKDFEVYLINLPFGKDPDDLREEYLTCFNNKKYMPREAIYEYCIS